MTNFTDISTHVSCDCTDDALPAVPRSRDNPPGQSELRLRVGEHATFKAAMLARLARTGALRRLTMRQDDDPAIVIIDGWACLLDILAFYQERIANEGYLRTAQERFSVMQLANTVGYRLRPGVGSSTYLSFECEVSPSTPVETTIPAGTQVQSTPEPDQTAQIFETKEDLVGRPRWNALVPRLTLPQKVRTGTRKIYLSGVNTDLNPGDKLLFVEASTTKAVKDLAYDLVPVLRVTKVEPERRDDPLPSYSLVRLTRAIKNQGGARGKSRKLVFDVYAVRQRAAAFGHNAMRWADLPLPLRVGEMHPSGSPFLTGPYASRSSSWAGARYAESTTVLRLDQVYNRLTKGGWVALTGKGKFALYKIISVRERTHTDFLLSAKVTRLKINGSGIGVFSPRTLSAYCQSEKLELAGKPYGAVVTGRSVILNEAVEGLEPGRLVAVAEISKGTEKKVGEVVRIDTVSTTLEGRTRLVFETALAFEYDRHLVRINANVVQADLGATRGEILGDGDAAATFKTYSLQSSPLTYVSAANSTGAASTLQLRVDGQLWDEVESFFGHDSTERIYTLSHDDDGKVTVRFGDGITSGGRPASGTSNVTASLRVGIGTDGNLPVGRIDQLLTRPLGAKGVINDVAASGAADPEGLEDARDNATRRVRMVDRIVSLRDYEDFAAGFAGIYKALAQALWTGDRRIVCLTVSGADGEAVAVDSDLYVNLRDAIDLARHADEPVRIENYLPKAFACAAHLTIAPDSIVDDVVAAAGAALMDAFSFNNLRFGKAVARSELFAILHAQDGVLGVRILTLDFAADTGVVLTFLPARLARFDGGSILPAELLVLEPGWLSLSGAF